MKKIGRIVADVCIAFIFVSLIVLLVMIIKDLSMYASYLSENRTWYNVLISQQNTNESSINIAMNNIAFYKPYVVRYSLYTALGFLSIAACIFVFIYCNPRLFRRSTWTNLSEEWSQAKSDRVARKQKKAEADKQKRLKKLQAEIEELKRE